jgi:hypothetical protein
MLLAAKRDSATPAPPDRAVRRDRAAARIVVGALALLAGAVPVLLPTLPAHAAAVEAAAAGARRGRDPALSPAAAVALADSLLRQVSALRGLEPLRSVPVEVEDRSHIRRRIEAIASAEELEAQAKQDERLLQFLGLVPGNLDLFDTYKDVLEEQLAGLYDMDQRVLVLADWVPANLQAPVAAHELTHALQDQHFGLRVRRRLGFDTPDAEAAWAALTEGDATAVMLQCALQGSGKNFTAVLDSELASPGAAALVPSGPDTKRFQAAPRVVREALSFPYLHGVRFAAALFAHGGWEQLDAAYVHPPVSTEQILHPERYGGAGGDRPVRVELPDVRGILGPGYEPQLTESLGELDLQLYLGEYIDPQIAAVASEGWGGCSVALYRGSGKDGNAFVLSSVWDSEDDALEFFGGLLGALEKRYPDQTGIAEQTTTDQVTWNVDKTSRLQNVVRMRERTVVCLERVPSASVVRLLQKLDAQTRIDDPTPEMRATSKEQLAWNHPATQPGDSSLVLHVDLPEGWSRVPADRPDVLLEARRAGARLKVAVDRDATDRLGTNGYTHVLAARIQQHGTNVFVQTDVVFPRPDGLRLYEHVFTQLEEGRQVVYHLGVADLGRGFGTVQITEPKDGRTPAVADDFKHILETLRVVPATEELRASAGRDSSAAAGGP